MTTENKNTTPAPTAEEQLIKRREEEKRNVQVFKDKKETVSKLLDSCKGMMLEALPKFLTPEKMIRVMLTAMSNTPKLLECTPVSLVSSLMTCGQLGLLPDPFLGEVYLIPYGNKCTVVPGYKGLSTLAMRSGFVSKIAPKAVYKGDFFEYEFGLEEKLIHRRGTSTNPDDITHFYCIITMKDGTKHWDVMSRKEVEEIRNNSANYKSAFKKEDTIWHKYFQEMGNKTVLRRLMKYVPLSPELQKAIALDEIADAGKQKLSHQFADFGGPVADDAIAEIIEDEEGKQEEKKENQAEELKDKSDAATQATLNLVNDAQKNKAT